MKFISSNKILFKLIVALCIFLTLTSIGLPTRVFAEGEGASSWFGAASGTVESGGKLLTPIVDLILVLGDSVIDILQDAVMGTDSAITIDTAKKVIVGILSILAAAIIAVAVIMLLGPLAGSLGFLASLATGAVGVLALGSGLLGGAVAYGALSGVMLPDFTVLPTYSISPEEIFKGEILLFDVNIFNPRELYVKVTKDSSEQTRKASEWNALNDKGGYEVKYYYYYKDRNPGNNNETNIIVTSANNSAAELKSVVSAWYYTIRNLALVGLMVVLAYVGIRMMISTTASEKSKYKQMLGDWVVAMCLIFVMQFIMVIANNATESITLIFSSVADKNLYSTTIEKPKNELKDAVKEAGFGDTIEPSTGNIVWPSNLMGKARLMAQEQNGTPGYVGYGVCFLVLVIYTVIFTITYAKRLLYIIFFSIIAPLVALTYPLDKINDGKAQAFNVWLREYIFNLLIQPFHLLLYTVLISTAFNLAGTNIIYTLVAMGFMMPAEKFLRKMFGFDKASTPGFLEGATGAAFAMHGLQSLQKIAGKGKDSKEKDKGDNGKIDFMNRSPDSGHKTKDLINKMGSDSPDSPNNTPPRNDDTIDHDEDVETPEIPDTVDTVDAPEEQETPDTVDTVDAPEEQETPDTVDTVDAPEEQETPDTIDTVDAPEEQETPDTVDTADAPETEDTPETQDTPEELLEWKKGKRLDYAKAYARAWGRNYVRHLKSKEEWGKTSEAVFKKGSSLAMGFGGAMIGAAAGIATGNLDAVGKNTVAGGYAGSAIGTGMANSTIRDIHKSKTKKEETLKEMYGDKYSDYVKKKKDDEFVKDAGTRELYAREFSDKLKDLKGKEKEKKLDEILENVREYRRYGVTDNTTIIKAMKKGNETDWSSPERIAAAKLSQVSKTEDDLQSTMASLRKKVGKDQADRVENYIRTMNDMIN